MEAALPLRYLSLLLLILLGSTDGALETINWLCRHQQLPSGLSPRSFTRRTPAADTERRMVIQYPS